MTLQSLGPLLEELHAVLQGRGCTVTEIAVTLYPMPAEDRDAVPPGPTTRVNVQLSHDPVAGR